MPDDLELPFIFVPDNAPEPVEWMAQHPGWVRIPATRVPHPKARAARPPPVPVAALAGSAGAAGGALRAAPFFADGGWNFATMSVEALLARVAAPFAVVGIFYPTSTASPAQDELPSELRPHAGMRESLIPPPPTPPLPGLIPPAGLPPKPVGGGFAPAPPTPPSPGLTPPISPSPVLPGHPAEPQGLMVFNRDRNKGLEGGARTYSYRARAAARLVDPEVTSILRDDEWEAHHLLPHGVVRKNPDVSGSAVRGGWHMDNARNIIAVPISREAQDRLKKAGIHRPVHDNSHSKWSNEVEKKLMKIGETSEEKVLDPEIDSLDQWMKMEFEKLQDDLRRQLLNYDRMTKANLPDSAIPA